MVTNSDALIEALHTKFKELRNNEESFLKFDRYTTVIWYLRFIQLLMNLYKENADRQPLIDHLKICYVDDRNNFEKVLQFEREYSSSTAVNWYTKDSFVYRILNKAFRSFDFEILILFRFFIGDLYQQLYNLYDKNNTPREMICYRGQQMYKSKFEALEENQRICSTSFFSATFNRNLALIFSGASDVDGLLPVLFNIRPFHFNYNRSILANVSALSEFGNGEQEILFAAGTCFRIDRIWFRDSEKVWIIELQEDYVEDERDKSNRSFHMDIITIGFYLLVEDDDFQSVQKFYNILLKEANSLLWLVSCNVGLGLIEYYKKNYSSALKIFENTIKIIDEENLLKTCEMIGNIYCILANIHREMNNYDKALEFYKKAAKIKINYFIEEDRCFWKTYIYKTKLNPFVKDDKYFYYCDRPSLNMVLLYKRTQQWNLARDTFQKVLNDFFERKRNGEVAMFVKILGYDEENRSAYGLIERNRAFLGGKTLATFLDKCYKEYALYAYIELGNHYLNHICLDHALLCFEEILQGEIEFNIIANLVSFDGMGRVYEMKQEYTMAIHWFKKANDLRINDMSEMDSSFVEIYQKIFSIYNEKLMDILSPFVYMKEMINNLLKSTDDQDKVNNLIATVYKLTVQFYHHNDKTKIQSICDHIQEVLEKININGERWKKWLCIGSTCNLKKFQENYHRCDPIIDENYNAYLKLYQKIFHILSNDTSKKLETEISQCKWFLCHLKLVKARRKSEIIKLWTRFDERINLTRSLSQSSFFMPSNL